MNGIYDFENYRTPYLDTEMLMEYKARKREKRMLCLAGLASVLLMVLSVLVLYHQSTVDKELFALSMIVFAVYLIIGVIVVGIVVKRKGEYVWLE